MERGSDQRGHQRLIRRNKMNKFSMRGVSTLAVLWLLVTAATAETATARIVKAADAFLATLDAKQRQSVLYAFDDEQQRARWSNLPTGFVPRGGMSLKEMNATQRSAAMTLLSSALSKTGLEKVQQIMEGDEVNKNVDANRPQFGGGGPPAGNGPPPQAGANRPPMRGPGG